MATPFDSFTGAYTAGIGNALNLINLIKQRNKFDMDSMVAPYETQAAIAKNQAYLQQLPQEMSLANLKRSVEGMQANDALQNFGSDQQLKRDTARLAYDQARAKPSVKGVFNADLGGFVYEPTAQNPNGMFIPVGGAKKAVKSPMSASLQKELIDADEGVQAGNSVVNTIDSALKINDKALSGFGAGARAAIADKLPDWMVPDAIASKDEALATIGLDNMTTGQALESLKQIFGGMPTEGERKILLDMQASVDKSPAARKMIFERAKQAAENRMSFNKAKADAIRGGTYLNEGVQVPQGGLTVGAVQDGYVYLGGDPSSPNSWKKSGAK